MYVLIYYCNVYYIDKVLSKCTYFDELYPLIHDKPKVNTPFRIDSEGDLASEADRVLGGNDGSDGGEDREEDAETTGVTDDVITRRLQAGLDCLHRESDEENNDEDVSGIFGDNLVDQVANTCKRSASYTNTDRNNKRQYTKKGPSLVSQSCVWMKCGWKWRREKWRIK